MNEILLNILSVVVSAVVIPLIAFAGRALIKFVEGKTKNDYIRRLVCEAVEAAQLSVEMVTQTYVDTLKREGKFNSATHEIAFCKAKENAKQLITEEAKEIITQVHNDFDKWLDTTIEALVQSQKDECN